MQQCLYIENRMFLFIMRSSMLLRNFGPPVLTFVSKEKEVKKLKKVNEKVKM